MPAVLAMRRAPHRSTQFITQDPICTTPRWGKQTFKASKQIRPTSCQWIYTHSSVSSHSLNFELPKVEVQGEAEAESEAAVCRFGPYYPLALYEPSLALRISKAKMSTAPYPIHDWKLADEKYIQKLPRRSSAQAFPDSNFMINAHSVSACASLKRIISRG